MRIDARLWLPPLALAGASALALAANSVPATAADEWFSPEVCDQEDLSPEFQQRCESQGEAADVCRARKNRAATRYYGCLLEADDEAQRARCDHRFAAAFERADWRSPGCEPLDDLDRTQAGVRAQAQQVQNGDVSLPPCAVLSASDGRVYCQLHAPGTVTATTQVSLAAVLNQFENCAACANVNEYTVLWLQAWGAGIGDQHGGFAQTVTSINELTSAGTLTLYYYLGASGNADHTTGHQGNAATLVTREDLQAAPAQEPDFAQMILIAGGAGGQGGENENCSLGHKPGTLGGSGGVAIATTAGAASGQGGAGGPGGGGQGQGGGSGNVGADGVGGRGGSAGAGSSHSLGGNPAWFNTGSVPLTFGTGQGGGGNDGSGSSCLAGGGGGGGGWGGGGGGTHGTQSVAATGGGGGGSYAIKSTQSDAEAPTERVAWSGSGGQVQLVFNTNADPS